MKITKGTKLTTEQKAQRTAARQRNLAARLAEQRQWEMDQRRTRETEKANYDAVMAQRLANALQENADLKMKNSAAIQIDLKDSPITAAALAYFQGIHHPSMKEPNPAFMAIRILRLALVHPEQISAWIDKLCKYRSDEGYEETAHSDQKIIYGWLAGRKEYKVKVRKNA